jgi:aryl-alcohol dehydrogenase-like predicted oxidoreductase
VLHRAVELGVNHIDTAAFYFSSLRSANELINTALAPYPDGLVIVTKVGPGRDPSGEWLPAARPDQLRGQVEENLRQLGRDHLDVVNLRRMPSMDSLAEHFDALADLCDAGLIRHLGLSGVTPGQLAEAQAVAPVACMHNRYGIGASPRITSSSMPAGSRASRLCPSSRSLAKAGRRRDRPREPGGARRRAGPRGRRPHRSGWRGRCSTGRTSWPSQAPAIPIT